MITKTGQEHFLYRDPKTAAHARQEIQVVEWVRRSPDVAQHGMVRWRRSDLVHEINVNFGVAFAKRSISTMLRSLDFRQLVARPRHPGHDAGLQASFGMIRRLVTDARPDLACG